MLGIGKIFQLYKSGKIDADDEVAVTFDPEGDYRLQSEAMIDIRYNLFLAHKKGVMSRQAKRAIARVAKATYFPHRNYSNIIEETKSKHPELAGEIDSFQSYIASSKKSLKEIDAMRLVKYLKERSQPRV
jgi:hypothetical protein